MNPLPDQSASVPIPEWVILEGIAYRRSDEHPAEPPWTHVVRAFKPASDEDRAMPDLPYYLREDADPACQCDSCERESWDVANVGQRCAMSQPSGAGCDGTMQPVNPGAYAAFDEKGGDTV
jgi:hypothetical protein